MKINPVNPYSNISKTDKVRKSDNVTKKSNTVSDQVQISDEAKSIDKLIQKAKSSESDRTEKVEALKRQIEDGSYKVDSQKLAEKMIDTLKNNE
ncbi:MAG: flagellar biosynthesis anti-sigma factor FlgM [Clostridia bacterium]|nr:flagellar biosynthesis anti-sigma factor FlgM [Clostridia bacterium]